MLFNRDRAYALLAASGLDGLVGGRPANAYYLSDARPFFLEWDLDEAGVVGVLPTDPGNEPILVIAGLYISYLLEIGTWVPRIQLYDWFSYNAVVYDVLEPGDEHSRLNQDVAAFKRERVIGRMEPDVVHATAAALKAAGLHDGRVGFDDLRLAHAVKALPGFERLQIVDGYDLFVEIRKVRSPHELTLHRLGARINQTAIERVLEAAEPGIPYSELAKIYRMTWAEFGGRATSDKGLLWTSTYKGEHVPAHFTLKNNDFRLEEGRMYIFELYGNFRGYSSDGSRTLFVGDPPVDYLRAVDAIMRAHQAIEAELRPGSSTERVYKAAMAVMEDSALPAWKKTIVATHGVGLDAVEWYAPYPAQIAVPRSYTLEENVVLGMDVLYYGSRPGPFHFENQLLITADGPRSFYAPSTTDRILPKGLMIRSGGRLETYCPSDVRLAVEAGIPAPLEPVTP